MSGKCRFCSCWQSLSYKSWFGTCNHPAVAKQSNLDNAEADELVMKGGRSGAELFVGDVFGCVHWTPSSNPKEGIQIGQIQISPLALRKIMTRNKMKPIDLARQLGGIRIQRVSDWLNGRRKVPKLAVVAMFALDLISPNDV